MRKHLLTKVMLLAAMLVGATNSWADTWTWTASGVNDLGSTSTGGGSSANVTLNGKAWTSVRTLKSGETYTGTSLISGCIQLGKNGGVDNVSLTTSAFAGYKINSVSVECSSYNNAHKCSISVGEDTYLASTATAKWTTISTLKGTGTTVGGDIDIEFTDGSRALYIKSITVEYEVVSSVEKPTFSPDGGVITEATAVTMSAETGCTIYYTTDGTTPTTSSSSGTSVVIPAFGTTTLKAIAVNESDEESAVATAVYTYKDPNALSESKTSFSSTSGVLESIISFESFQGGAGNAPANYNSGIRLYQISGSNKYGGYITLTAASGYKITGFKITSTNTYATTVDYDVDGGTTVGTGSALAKSGDYEVSDLFNSSVSIFNIGTGSSGRLEIGAIEVYYVYALSIKSACTDGSKYYGTYYLDKAYKMPTGLTGQVVKVSSTGVLTIEDAYEVGDVVPAYTALLIKADAAGDYELTLSTGGDDWSEYNDLKGTLTADEMTAGDGCLFYRLTMHNGTDLGFYWGAADGAAFKPGANKAYLAVPAAQGANIIGFTIGDESTGIGNLDANLNANNAGVYNLQGQRVSGNQKGLLIKNGRKYIVK